MNKYIFNPQDPKALENAAWIAEYWARKSFELHGDNPRMWEWLLLAARIRSEAQEV